MVTKKEVKELLGWIDYEYNLTEYRTKRDMLKSTRFCDRKVIDMILKLGYKDLREWRSGKKMEWENKNGNNESD